MQSNRFCSGEEICVIGKIALNDGVETEPITTDLVSQLDDIVTNTLSSYLKESIIPIVIGGGHNNAYPIIRALSLFNERKINVINLDPHADCRALEGRHSGNSFSYAKHDGYLHQYTVLGLHKSYNSEYLLNYLDQNEFNFTFFEDYIDDPKKLKSDIQRFCNGLAHEDIFGIELDLDSISGMPSSAYTPSGLSVNDARFYIRQIAQNQNAIYLHLPEAAPRTSSEEKLCGKTLAYLTWDFITANFHK
jgi:formiminoglutamase